MSPTPRRPGAAAWFWMLILAGLAVAVTSLIASGGNIFSTIEVRAGSAPALGVLTIGIVMVLLGLLGLRSRRDE